jgi:hypothetical protein
MYAIVPVLQGTAKQIETCNHNSLSISSVLLLSVLECTLLSSQPWLTGCERWWTDSSQCHGTIYTTRTVAFFTKTCSSFYKLKKEKRDSSYAEVDSDSIYELIN